jgi:hypothetical protein
MAHGRAAGKSGHRKQARPSFSEEKEAKRLYS